MLHFLALLFLLHTFSCASFSCAYIFLCFFFFCIHFLVLLFLCIHFLVLLFLLHTFSCASFSCAYIFLFFFFLCFLFFFVHSFSCVSFFLCILFLVLLFPVHTFSCAYIGKNVFRFAVPRLRLSSVGWMPCAPISVSSKCLFSTWSNFLSRKPDRSNKFTAALVSIYEWIQNCARALYETNKITSNLINLLHSSLYQIINAQSCISFMI